MKRLLVVILGLAAFWSGYWYLAMTGARSGYEDWFADRRAQGWQADYAQLEINGFPNRIDATFTEPALAEYARQRVPLDFATRS